MKLPIVQLPSFEEITDESKERDRTFRIFSSYQLQPALLAHLLQSGQTPV